MAETAAPTRLADYAHRITTRDYAAPDPHKWAEIAAAWRDAPVEERAEFVRAVPHVVGGAVSRAIDAEARTVDLSFSSEEPYARWWGVEILDHAPGAVNLERLNNGGAVLVEHRTDDHIGTVVAGTARLDGSKGRAVARFGRSARAAEVFGDVQDEIKTLVSVGYMIDEMVLESRDAKTGTDTYRVTKWTPFEVSLVAVPADPSVGIGRSLFQSPAGLAPSVPAARESQEKSAMTTAVTETPAPAAAPAAPAIDIKAHLRAERDRQAEIRALGAKFNLQADAETACNGDTTAEQFKGLVVERMERAGTLRPAESPEIGLSEKEIGKFSFSRAILAAMDPAEARALAPFEYECSRAAKDKRSDGKTDREAGMTIPVDVLNCAIAVKGAFHEAAAARAARELIARHMQAARDLVVGTPTAGGNLVATELLGSSFIELLRNAMILDRLGVRWLRDLNGNIAIPRQTGGATSYWVAENSNLTESQQAVDQVTMSPKTVGAFTDYSRRLLLQSSIDTEMFVRSDLAITIAQALQAAAIAGPGTGNQPTGLLNISGTGAVAGGVNGAAPTYDLLVDLETAVANANAANGNLGFVTNSKVRGKLRKTQVFTGTNGSPVWTSSAGSRGLEGEVLGYPAIVTNAVPSNLDKGTATGVCSAAIFGNFAELLIGMWGGLDILYDPYTGGIAGTKRLIALQDVDINVRHPASFSVFKDILTT